MDGWKIQLCIARLGPKSAKVTIDLTGLLTFLQRKLCSGRFGVLIIEVESFERTLCQFDASEVLNYHGQTAVKYAST